MENTNENLETAEEASAIDDLEIVEELAEEGDEAEASESEEACESPDEAQAGDQAEDASEAESAEAAAESEAETEAEPEAELDAEAEADDDTADEAQAAEEAADGEEAKAEESEGDAGDSTEGDAEADAGDNDSNGEDASDDASNSEDASEEPAKKKRSKKGILIACGSVAGALAIAYVGGAVYFSSHFLPNTTLNGDEVSLKTVEEVAGDIDSRVSSINPHFEGEGMNLSFSTSDISFTVDSESYARSALQQGNNFAWPAELFNSHELTANFPVTYDKGALTRLVHSAVEDVNKDGKEPTDAYIEFNKKELRYAVVDGDPGSLLDERTIIAMADTQLQSLSGEVAITAENLKKAQVTSDDEKLNAAADEANGYVTNEILFKSADVDEIYTLDAKTLKEWVTISDDLEVTFDEDAARTWLDESLRSKVDTAGSTRKYKNENGDKVEVTGGTYGWAFSLDGVTDKVIKKIKAKKGGSIKLKTLKKGAVWNPGGKDWDGAYIDIDLGDQYARLFNKKGKVVWESNIVSGNTSAGHGTPTGVYVINDTMARNVTLVSSTTDSKGKPTYESPVSYWMPFVDNSVGLHDATWRSEFGGGIYTYNGSHGCVNLPYSNAATLYELVEPGTVVSCHY